MNLNVRKAVTYRIILLLISILILSASTGAYAFTTITILPGKLNNFRIHVPTMVSAGSKFTVKLVALDDYGNVITDFANKYEGLNIRVNIGNNNSTEELDIPASEFKNGAVQMFL